MSRRKQQEEAAKMEAADQRYRMRQIAAEKINREGYKLLDAANRKTLEEAAEQFHMRLMEDLNDAWRQTKYKPFVDPDPGSRRGSYEAKLAEDVVEALRDYDASPPSVWSALSDALLDVRFTIDDHDAWILVAALLRQIRQEGFVEGVRWADKADAATMKNG